MAKASIWSKLRERTTLPTNEQCLLDLDQRLQTLEALAFPKTGGPAAGGAGRNGQAAGSEGAAEAAPDAAPAAPPEIAPVPVQERLPELHELDAQGRCWAYRNASHEPHGRAWILGTPVSLQLTRPWCSFSHWLPHWCLPILEDPSTTTNP
ncbi:MAG: hypothetical protein ACK5IA_08245 [Cyanobacteriota bacterium]